MGDSKSKRKRRPWHTSAEDLQTSCYVPLHFIEKYEKRTSHVEPQILSAESVVGNVKYLAISWIPNYKDDVEPQLSLFDFNQAVSEPAKNSSRKGTLKKLEPESKPSALHFLPIDSSQKAPQICEMALLFFLTKENRDSLIGDIEEEFFGIAEKYGVRFAKAWYWKQTVCSCFNAIWNRLLVLAGATALWKLMGRLWPGS